LVRAQFEVPEIQKPSSKKGARKIRWEEAKNVSAQGKKEQKQKSKRVAALLNCREKTHITVTLGRRKGMAEGRGLHEKKESLAKKKTMNPSIHQNRKTV